MQRSFRFFRASPSSPSSCDEYNNEMILPISDPHSIPGKKEASARSRTSFLSEKWIHLIPLILILCVFILWWFYHPVSVKVIEGKLISVDRVEKQPLTCNTQVAMAASFWDKFFLFASNTNEAILVGKLF